MDLADRVGGLVAAHDRGRGLARDFYLDDELFTLELELIWAREWLFVAASADLAAAGAFVTLGLFGNPIVLVRGLDGTVRAFHNVCRHRGSLAVEQTQGRVERLVCPYHRWSYGLDGTLLAAPGFNGILERGKYPLRELASLEVTGLVFVRLEGTRDPTPMRELFARAGKRQRFDRTAVAARRRYLVRANWKLILENNRECLHCAPNHPEYVAANFDRYSSAEAHRFGLVDALARHKAAIGDDIEFLADGGLHRFPDATGAPFSANRTALRATHRTESIDGDLVAPPMGDFAGADIGTLRLRALPNFWCHASTDHAVITRLIPRAIDETEVEVIWLVDAEAKAGRDYDTERLVAFWARTSEQDWAICERQQLGVGSRAYLPGPLSPTDEANVDTLLGWYLGVISAAALSR